LLPRTIALEKMSREKFLQGWIARDK
jgi:hypothetical protein